MTPALTSTAYVLHNLGLAAGFGGSLFGKIALNPAVELISDKAERGQVANTAWNGYNIVNGISLGLTALTWIVGRRMISGREFGADTRRWVVAKDAFLATTIATGAVNIGLGAYLAKQGPEGRVPVQQGDVPAPETPPTAAKVQRTINVLGFVNLCAMAGVIACTTVLNNKASTRYRWAAFARFLP